MMKLLTLFGFLLLGAAMLRADLQRIEIEIEIEIAGTTWMRCEHLRC